METKRRTHKNSLYVKKQTLEKSIQRDHDTIDRLKRNSSTEDVYVANRIEKMKESIITKELQLEEVVNDINKVNVGLLDDEINKSIITDNDEVKRKNIENKKMKAVKKREKEEDKKTSQDYWKQIISSSRDQSKQRRDARYFLKQLRRIDESLPNYIRKNLSEMPHNKGYIWRGVHYYGKLPEQRGQPHIMFEKRRNNILRIIETTAKEQRIYEKYGKDRKVLVSIKKRRIIKNGDSSILDYMKK